MEVSPAETFSDLSLSDLSLSAGPGVPLADVPLALPPATLSRTVALSGELEDGFDYGAFASTRGEQVEGEATEEDPAARLRRLIESAL